jgi:excinuclease ABC subunit C
VAAIREVLATLPARPGVYRMTDVRGDVLYVGKARALRNRVANYTQVERLPLRLQRMVSQCRGMTIVTTNSEAEALLLEAQLIKRFRPPYNVLLRDDKSFPFILLRTDHDFPRIMKHRGARKAVGNYYGPFASAGSVNTTINALQKLFLLRSCTDSFMSRRDRPCLLYQIKRCSAPASTASTRRAMKTLCGRPRISSAANPRRFSARSRARWRRLPRTSISSAPPCCVTGCARRPSFRALRRSMPRACPMPTSSPWR